MGILVETFVGRHRTKHCEFLVNYLVAKTLIRDGLMTLLVACEMGWSFSNVFSDA